MTPVLPEGLDNVLSPALLVFEDALEQNLDRMVAMAGDPARLRPHVKTHKMPAVVNRLVERGIRKAKCATLAEAHMLLDCGVDDILLAHPPVGPSARAWAKMVAEHPAKRLRTIVDHADTVIALSEAICRFPAATKLDVLVDIDNGMHRTGIGPGAEVVALAERIATSPGLRFGGLHIYDGHVRDPDPKLRHSRVEADYAPVEATVQLLTTRGLAPERVVVGGTPSFAVHAGRESVECSPGTTTLWDMSSHTQFPDLGFRPAAAMLTRVVSKPGGNRLCCDLGHKAVASEMPHPRVLFPGLGAVDFVGHSEEHLVFETPLASRIATGTALLGIPWHICPTVALHDAAVWVREGRVAGSEPVTARSRVLFTD